MLKINRQTQSFSLLDTPKLAEVSITERYDLQEFISNSPDAFFSEIGQELFLLGKEILPSKTVQDRIDLLAVDKEGTCVVTELKRGNHKLHMLQAISYAGMLSQWAFDDFMQLLDDDGQEALIEFLEVERCHTTSYRIFCEALSDLFSKRRNNLNVGNKNFLCAEILTDLYSPRSYPRRARLNRKCIGRAGVVPL
jgi:hypothetical protein